MLNEIIYNHYKQADSGKKSKVFKPEDTVFFNPSSFSACRRQIFYKKRNVAPSNPIDAISLLKMQFGTVLHTTIQNTIQRLGILIEAEKLKVKEFEGLHFRFKTDGIVVLNKQRTIMELKTVSSGGLRMVRDEPKEADVIQMVLYTIFEEISHGVLLYIGRDNALVEEYSVHKGDYLYNRALDTIHKKIKELKVLEIQIKNGVVPNKDGYIELKNTNGKVSNDFQKNKLRHKGDFRCRYCQWHDLCWQKELEEIKTHKFYLNGEFTD